MNILEQITEHLKQVSEGNNWTDVNLAATLQDVTLQEATTVGKASANTIAALQNHLTYWNRVMVQRINGIAVDVPEINGFDVPELKTENEWNDLKADYSASVNELVAAIKTVDENTLMQPILPGYSTVYKNLQGTVEHIHYHLGQMVMIKKLLRS